MAFLDMELSLRRMGDQGEIAVVRIAGEVDVYTFPKLREFLKAELLDVDEPPLWVGLEMSELQFWDSCGLGVAVGFLKQFRARRPAGGVAIVAPSERVAKILRLTGLTKVFPVVEDEAGLLQLILEWGREPEAEAKWAGEKSVEDAEEKCA